MFRKQSIRTKLSVAVAALATLMALLTAIFILSMQYRESFSELRGDSVTTAVLLRQVLPHPMRLSDDFEVFRLISAPFQTTGLQEAQAKGLGGRSLQHILLLDDQGVVLSSSHPQELPLNQLHSKQEPEFLPLVNRLTELKLDEMPMFLPHDNTGGFYVFVAVGEGGVKYANLLLDYSAQPLRADFLHRGMQVVVMLLLIGTVLILIGMFWTEKLSRPLISLNHAVHRIAERRRLTLEPEQENIDEFRLLWNSFRQLDTALDKAEQSSAVFAQREKLALAALDHSTQGIFITDVQGRIEYVNAAFERVTGYGRNEIIGLNPKVLKSGKTTTCTYDSMWETLNSRKPWCGELINRHRDGSEYVELITISPVSLTGDDVTHYLAIQEDISERLAAEAAIRYQAEHDALTGLPNRLLLGDRLGQAIKNAARANEKLALMFLDLDHFKQVNDLLGHHIGDELLKIVAQRLQGILRASDTVCRLGGDEFVILLGTIQGVEEVKSVADKVVQTLLAPYVLTEGKPLKTSVSVGVALYPEHGATAEELTCNADIAMYHAKGLGRNRCQLFESNMHSDLQERVTLEEEIELALNEQQFVLHYQPQFSAETGLLCGIEALIRWQHPVRGLVFPVDFIERAETSGKIVEIGAWVIDEACRQVRVWLDAGLEIPFVAVNVSFRQFHQHDLETVVDEALNKYNLPGERLELELTESVMLSDPEKVYSVLRRLKNRGVKFSIDDFGTGYSSLQYLKKLDVDTLKIDRSFVLDISSSRGRAMVETIIGIAENLQLHTTAEGVETDIQRALLQSSGCKHLQGYLFSKPLPADALQTKLEASRNGFSAFPLDFSI